jgi:hypothetical protein
METLGRYTLEPDVKAGGRSVYRKADMYLFFVKYAGVWVVSKQSPFVNAMFSNLPEQQAKKKHAGYPVMLKVDDSSALHPGLIQSIWEERTTTSTRSRPKFVKAHGVDVLRSGPCIL